MKRALAALMFFTRLPLHRWVTVPGEYFSRVVELWPLAGWLTGGVTALVLWGAALVFTPMVAVILALTARILLTGALHEDGLADFCDGFGGGHTRDRVLAIMKDSHIGTYGVLGLGLYMLALVACWVSIPVGVLVWLVPAGDCWSKFCAAQIINFLPYARKAEEAKSGTVYVRFGAGAWMLALVIAALPMIFVPEGLLPCALAPVVTVTLLILLIKRRIGGYTGDCCGAVFLLSELSFYLVAVALCC